MSIFLYKIPFKHSAAFNAGAVERFGAILKNTSTGQIVGHMQPTGALSGVLNGAMAPISNLTSGLTPLGSAVSMIQNNQILTAVREIQTALPLLKGLGAGTLLFSGAGLGVSVATLVVMQKRLTAIENRLTEISAQVDRVTDDRRDDELHELMYKVKGAMEEAYDLNHRKDPHGAALRLEGSLNEY
jgi:hypothetical protein